MIFRFLSSICNDKRFCLIFCSFRTNFISIPIKENIAYSHLTSFKYNSEYNDTFRRLSYSFSLINNLNNIKTIVETSFEATDRPSLTPKTYNEVFSLVSPKTRRMKQWRIHVSKSLIKNRIANLYIDILDPLKRVRDIWDRYFMLSFPLALSIYSAIHFLKILLSLQYKLAVQNFKFLR